MDKRARPPEEMIDILHLERQIQGDASLRDELLHLYGERLAALAPLVCGEPGPGRGEAAHALKGASLAVGAFPLARLCGALEQGGAESEAATREALGSVIDGTRRRLDELLRSGQ